MLHGAAAPVMQVSVLFDLTQSGYGAFDNLSIVASDDTGAITTTDALRTLQHAVGPAVPLLCPN